MKRRLPLVAEKALAEVQSVGEGLSRKLRVGLGEEVTCRKGCDHCCYHPLTISLLEGIHLFRRLKKEGLWTSALKSKMQGHFEAVAGLTPEVWLLSDMPCPLLTAEGLCSAYEARPFVCRTTFSLGDPEACMPARFSAATPLANRQAEMESYYKAEKRLLKGLRLAHNRVPLSLAILVGELLEEGHIEIASADAHVLSTYAKEDL